MVETNMALVAQLTEQQTMKYTIEMDPGHMLSAKSLGKQLVAIENLLAAVAKENHDATLTCMVKSLSCEGSKIEIGLILMHAEKGVKKHPEA